VITAAQAVTWTAMELRCRRNERLVPKLGTGEYWEQKLVRQLNANKPSKRYPKIRSGGGWHGSELPHASKHGDKSTYANVEMALRMRILDWTKSKSQSKIQKENLQKFEKFENEIIVE
jgi:hypothetical protein